MANRLPAPHRPTADTVLVPFEWHQETTFGDYFELGRKLAQPGFHLKVVFLPRLFWCEECGAVHYDKYGQFEYVGETSLKEVALAENRR